MYNGRKTQHFATLQALVTVERMAFLASGMGWCLTASAKPAIATSSRQAIDAAFMLSLCSLQPEIQSFRFANRNGWPQPAKGSYSYGYVDPNR